MLNTKCFTISGAWLDKFIHMLESYAADEWQTAVKLMPYDHK